MINFITKKIKKTFINLEKLNLKIIKNGLFFSILFIFISSILLVVNILFLHKFIIYKLGISLITSGLYFADSFIICGIIVDGIKNKNL